MYIPPWLWFRVMKSNFRLYFLALFLLAAVLAPATGRPAAAEAQAVSGIDLAISWEFVRTALGKGHMLATVSNSGNVTAYGVTVDTADSEAIRSLRRSPSVVYDGIVPLDVAAGSFNENTGLWTIGSLGPGASVTAQFKHDGNPAPVFYLPGYSVSNSPRNSYHFVGRVSAEAPPEPERDQRNNRAEGWMVGGVKDQQQFFVEDPLHLEYHLLGAVDERSPAEGANVIFTFQLGTIPGAAPNEILVGHGWVDLRAEIRLPPSLEYVSHTQSMLTSDSYGGTFDSSTGIWNFPGSIPSVQYLELTLTAKRKMGAPLDGQCMTATASNLLPEFRRPGPVPEADNTVRICLGDLPQPTPPLLLREGEVDLFTFYPCVGETDHPCNRGNGLEMVVLDISSLVTPGYDQQRLKLRPEDVVVQVHPVHGRQLDTDGNLIWTTGELDEIGTPIRYGVHVNFNEKLLDDPPWKGLHDNWTITGLGGIARPGHVKAQAYAADPADDFVYGDTRDENANGIVESGEFDPGFRSHAYVEFTALGTYLFGKETKATHNNNTPGDTTDDVEYTLDVTHTFHVGPVAELEVRDGGSSPGVAADETAFTVVAQNNGPDRAEGARVEVTLPTGATFVRAIPSAGTYDGNSGVWSVGPLQPVAVRQVSGQRAGETLTLVVSGVTAGDAGSTATATISNDNTNYPYSLTAGGTTYTGTVYDYRSGNDTATLTAQAGTGTPAPGTPKSVTGESKTFILVTWDEVDELNGSPVTHYEIEWSGDGETNWQQLTDDVPGPRYVDTGVVVGDTRYYRVRAVNFQRQLGPWSQPMKGTVSMSETASAGRPEGPVLTASLPEGADGRTQIDLGWEKPVENGALITSYTVEVADRSNGPWAAPDPAPQLGRSDTSWSHTGLTGGTRKYYRMKAANSQGDSDWSEVIDATTRAPGKAGPPLNLNAAPDGDSAIDLSWDPPLDDGGSPIRYYEVQWSADGTSGWRNAGRTTDEETRTFKHTGLSFGTTRYYRLGARNGVTLGEWSDPPASTKTLAGVPGVPGLTAKATASDTIELTWTEPGDNGSPIIRYELESSPDGGENTWTRLDHPSASDTSYNHSGLDPGDERHYRIRAVNGATPGEGSWSTVRKAVTPPAVPTPPTLRAEANGQNAIDVTWEPPFDDGGADISGYELHVSTDGSENSYSRLTSPSASARSYTHGNLQPGDERYYQLRARNRAGWSEFSQSASATTLTGVPASPNLTVRANGASEIRLSWTKPDDRGSDIYGYHLQQSDDGNDWTYLGGSIPARDTEYVHDGLSGGTTKHYRVRALNNNGDGQWSQARSARTDAGGPDAPVLTLTVMGDNQIDLSWTVPADNGSSIRGYWVERSVDGDAPWERLTSSNRTTEYSDTTLYRGMTRHYRVAAFNGAGTGPYSEAKSATTTGDPATAPAAPTMFRLSEVGRNQVTIAWDPPTDDGGAPVSGYEYEAAVPCEDDPNTPENESEYNCGYGFDGGIAITGTSVTIRNLNTDGDYFFQVRAVNIIGKGEWSRDIQARLRPSTNGQVRITPTTINVNEGATVTYTIRLSTAPPHPVQVWIQPQGGGGYNDIEEAAFAYTQSLLVPNGWTHPDPDEAPYWTEFSYNWSQGVRVTFTAPEDGDADDEVAVMDHFVGPLPYDHYRPCRQEDQAERDQCKQDWEDAWENSPYQQLTGASVKVTVRDND